MKLLRRLWVRFIVIVATLFLAGFLGTCFVTYAPGFGVDERELDIRYSAETLAAFRQQHAMPSNVFVAYGAFLRGAFQGKLGTSQVYEKPVEELLAERFPTTLRLVVGGLLLGWLLAAATAVVAIYLRFADLVVGLGATVFMAVPAAVIAILFLWIGTPHAEFAIAAILAPKLFRYMRNLLLAAKEQPFILAAHARGLAPVRVFLFHVLPSSAPQMIALAGISLTLAFSAAIPVEVICDIAGVGQLAWNAAMARDLPLLVTLTLVLTGITLIGNSGADMANESLGLVHDA